MMDVPLWPSLNAGLNATSGILITTGWLFIRARRVAAHRRCMVAALYVSGLFFISYLLYHARVGHVRFGATGWIRSGYLLILISHTTLAIVTVPLALRTAWLARRQRFAEHRALAHWTLPIWLYVSVSGVVVYFMLYICR